MRFVKDLSTGIRVSLKVTKHVEVNVIMLEGRQKWHWRAKNGEAFSSVAVDKVLEAAGEKASKDFPGKEFRLVVLGFDRFNFVEVPKDGASQPDHESTRVGHGLDPVDCGSEGRGDSSGMASTGGMQHAVTGEPANLCGDNPNP
jgi:hypothetical protein